jgi:co-chaperonin GroES (HSP10)
MIGYNDFIIKVDFVFAKTFTTESGLELHADSRLNQERLANRLAVVQEIPLNLINETPIKKGFQVMIDPTIFYENQYVATGVQQTPFTIDKNKGLYKIKNEMIVLYREDENAEWKANADNLLVRFKKEVVEEKKVGLIILEPKKEKTLKDRAIILKANQLIKEEGVNDGDLVFVQQGIGVPFWIEGVEYNWINNRHVLAIINQ